MISPPIYVPGGPGGFMKCPTCGEHTPDSWKPLERQHVSGSLPEDPRRRQLLYITTRSFEAAESASLDWMHCANPKCLELVIRLHEHWTVGRDHLPVGVKTETWVIRPRTSRRKIVKLIEGELRRDYEEAGLILDDSPRMSSVLSRKILGDLLEQYAKLKYNSLKTQIDKFIADLSHPYQLRENLHYLREIADFSAHTQTN